MLTLEVATYLTTHDLAIPIRSSRRHGRTAAAPIGIRPDGKRAYGSPVGNWPLTNLLGPAAAVLTFIPPNVYRLVERLLVSSGVASVGGRDAHDVEAPSTR